MVIAQEREKPFCFFRLAVRRKANAKKIEIIILFLRMLCFFLLFLKKPYVFRSMRIRVKVLFFSAQKHDQVQGVQQ